MSRKLGQGETEAKNLRQVASRVVKRRDICKKKKKSGSWEMRRPVYVELKCEHQTARLEKGRRPGNQLHTDGRQKAVS